MIHNHCSWPIVLTIAQEKPLISLFKPQEDLEPLEMPRDCGFKLELTWGFTLSRIHFDISSRGVNPLRDPLIS